MMDNKILETVRVETPPYSWFDLSHHHKTSIDMGYLYPMMCMETLPGDKFVISSEALLRMMPMIAPVMHKLEVYTHYFYVPYRILWKNWDNFIFPPRLDSELHAMPQVDLSTGYFGEVGDLSDYLGLPVFDFATHTPDEFVSALQFAAYQRIYWDYYRDENLSVLGSDKFEDWCPIQDGVQASFVNQLLATKRKRAWGHDYFTSCLPWAQKGEAVLLPIELTADVDLPVIYRNNPGTNQHYVDAGTGSSFGGPLGSVSNANGTSGRDMIFSSGVIDHVVDMVPNGTLYVTGATTDIVTSSDINQFRTAYALQRFLEKSARAGTRYTEGLRAIWGVTSSDARLQRAEYLGGARSIFSMSEVLQTGETGDTPQGNMAGHGITMMSGNTASYYCEEHGVIMSILSVRPLSEYAHGKPKMFSRSQRFDFALPDFAQLGEEEVLNKELLFTVDDTYNEGTFGYLPRYTDYKIGVNRISADIRFSLDYWSMHREVGDPVDPFTFPYLNRDFIECSPDKRIFAIDDPDERSIVVHMYNKIQARRPLPFFGTPSL